jgi:hypothetical protein
MNTRETTEAGETDGETVLMPKKPTKRAKGSVGEGEAGKRPSNLLGGNLNV